MIGKESDKYINHIYGEKELGGTCVLYITDTAWTMFCDSPPR